MTEKTYMGLHPGKLLLGVIMSLAITVCGILSKQIFYEIIISIFSVVTILYVIEGKMAGCVCGVIFCVVYAAVCFTRQIYGLMFFQIFIGIPSYGVSLFTWKKNQAGNRVAVKRLSAVKLAIITVASFAGYWGLFMLLGAIGSSNVIFDSLTLVFGTCGMVLLSLRYVEQWYFNIAASISVAVLWAFKLTESISNLNFMIVSVVFLICNIIGLVSWIKMGDNDKRGEGN